MTNGENDKKTQDKNQANPTRDAKGRIVKGTPSPLNPKNLEGNQKERKNRKDGRGGCPRLWTDNLIDGICLQFEEWLVDPENYYVYDFYYKVNIRRGQVDHLRREFPKFAELHLKAKEKEENYMFKIGLLEKKSSFLKWAICSHHNYRYDPDGKKEIEDLLKETLKKIIFTKDYSKDEDKEDKDDDTGA